ncbi:MAG: hypothetical protein KZQ95_19720 [Candidatus Thiodiazotropha sp. (ex Epidulcina cf. delphinae)]|nr:hypothetical protein [Candidatus Thiodiazotropha sp. (ex Epidulcina cf. delphinae)]
MEYETRPIKITALEVNTENPRFEMVANQREAIAVMIEDQKNKLVKLAQDIVENGLNPSDLVIVTPHEKHNGKFGVLEGNRRVTAIKLLSNNNLIPEKHKALLNKFRQLSSEFKRNPVKLVTCVIFSDVDEANKWIKLKHTGANDGIGTVTWDAQQKARFEERYEGKSTYALQIIDFLKKDKEIDEGIKKTLQAIPSSSLQRLLADPDVRDVIGIMIEDGRVVTSRPPSEIRKPLLKIVSDLARDDFTVKEIYYKDDRLNYLETFKLKDLPDNSITTPKWEVITPNPPKEAQKKRAKSRPLSVSRNTVIPKSCIIHINAPRINKIYRELKDLDLKYFVNAAAITFRVFVELSVDNFVESNNIKVTINEKLSNKISKVIDYMKSEKILTRDELKPINTAISSPNSIFSINTFNAYVHNKHFHPMDSDLKTTWDNIEPFMLALWDSK